MKSNSVSSHVLITPGARKTSITNTVRTVRVRSIRTVVVGRAVVQGGQNGGQERLLEQVGRQQLFSQYVPHRVGRPVVTVGRVPRVIL